jgi:hypothetical protein
MYSRPTEAPEALVPVRSGESVIKLHTEWARLNGASTPPASEPTSGGWRARLRGAQRALGRADREFLGDLVRAVDVLALRCDELAERLANQQAITGETAEILGQEVTRLRAAVAALNAGDSSPDA